MQIAKTTQNMNWKNLVARQSRKLNRSYKAWKLWCRRKERRERKKEARETLIYVLRDHHPHPEDLKRHIDEFMKRKKFMKHFFDLDV